MLSSVLLIPLLAYTTPLVISSTAFQLWNLVSFERDGSLSNGLVVVLTLISYNSLISRIIVIFLSASTIISPSICPFIS